MREGSVAKPFFRRHAHSMDYQRLKDAEDTATAQCGDADAEVAQQAMTPLNELMAAMGGDTPCVTQAQTEFGVQGPSFGSMGGMSGSSSQSSSGCSSILLNATRIQQVQRRMACIINERHIKQETSVDARVSVDIVAEGPTELQVKAWRESQTQLNELRRRLIDAKIANLDRPETLGVLERRLDALDRESRWLSKNQPRGGDVSLRNTTVVASVDATVRVLNEETLQQDVDIRQCLQDIMTVTQENEQEMKLENNPLLPDQRLANVVDESSLEDFRTTVANSMTNSTKVSVDTSSKITIRTIGGGNIDLENVTIHANLALEMAVDNLTKQAMSFASRETSQRRRDFVQGNTNRLEASGWSGLGDILGGLLGGGVALVVAGIVGFVVVKFIGVGVVKETVGTVFTAVMGEEQAKLVGAALALNALLFPLVPILLLPDHEVDDEWLARMGTSALGIVLLGVVVHLLRLGGAGPLPGRAAGVAFAVALGLVEPHWLGWIVYPLLGYLIVRPGEGGIANTAAS
jgi:hypothetical protein